MTAAQYYRTSVRFGHGDPERPECSARSCRSPAGGRQQAGSRTYTYLPGSACPTLSNTAAPSPPHLRGGGRTASVSDASQEEEEAKEPASTAQSGDAATCAWVGEQPGDSSLPPRPPTPPLLRTCAATAAGTEATETACRAAMAAALPSPPRAAVVQQSHQVRRRLGTSCSSR